MGRAKWFNTSAARRGLLVSIGVLAVVLVGPAPALGKTTDVGRYDWPTYGHDLNRTFHGSTELNRSSVGSLESRWFFRTGGPVTANPIRVGNTIYVGSWDGCFYAIDVRTGRARWSYGVALDQPAIIPRPKPGPCPRTVIKNEDFSDGGYITSSAYFLEGNRQRPDLVIFGGGFTLYALVANDLTTRGGRRFKAGQVYFERKFTGTGPVPIGRPARPLRTDQTRIFSSPAVVGKRVFFAVADGGPRTRGYLAAVMLGSPNQPATRGKTVWVRELSVSRKGKLENNGCGGVWSSPTIIRSLGLQVVGGSDCNYHAKGRYDERVLGVSLATGRIVWRFTPPRLARLGDDPGCNLDFGATANYSPATPSRKAFLGVGGKDGTYYRLNPATGKLIWERQVVFGGYLGGFLGSTAFDGRRVYGASGIGDYRELRGDDVCDPGNRLYPDSPPDLPIQEPSIHAFGPNGSIDWQGTGSQSLGPTTVAAGMTFVCTVIEGSVQIRNAEDGTLIHAVPLTVAPPPYGACSTGVVVSKNAIFLGTGMTQIDEPVGVWAFTPNGQPID